MEFLFGFLSYVYVTLAVAIGLGMVIFVHELGHFVVAKLCGVRCDKFYLGFDIAGYKLLKFKKGETEYGIGILPLGGYVKMLGQEDNPARLKDEIEKAKAAGKTQIEDVEGKPVDLETAQAALYDPRSYLAKSVPQRMAIISAGVIMNLIFAFIIAVIAFGLGVRQIACGVGGVLPGDAAWRADLQVGDKIVKINGRESVQFGDLKAGVSLGDMESGVPMVVERPGFEKPISLTLVPELGPDELMPTVGIIPPKTCSLWPIEGIGDLLSPGSPAAEAEPPLAPGDTIRKVGDVSVGNQAELYAQLALHRDKPLTFTVERKAEEAKGTTGEKAEPEIVEITMRPNPMLRFGFVMTMGPVAAVQEGSPAKEAGILPKDTLIEIDGEPAGDPMTLPSRLAGRAGRKISVSVRRPGVKEPVEIKDIVLRAVPRIEEPLSEGNPLSVSVLGLAYEVRPEIDDVLPESPAAKAGVKPGQIVESAVLRVMDRSNGSEVKQKLEFTLGETHANWPVLMSAVQQAGAVGEVDFVIGGTKVTLAAAPSAEVFVPDRGFNGALEQETFIRKARTLPEALALGGSETLSAASQVIIFVQKIGRQISVKALSGPLSIFHIAFATASEGPGQFLLFLTLLSANLAVINFLPIPILDGGHFVFLLYEGIRGKPADERLQIALSYMGFLFLITLMVWVFWLDIAKYLGGA